MSTIALFVAYGPEIRAFVHSGLVRELATRHRIIIYTPFPESRGFDTLSDIEIRPMPLAHDSKLLSKVRYKTKKMHEIWLSALGKEKWRHYLSMNSSAGTFTDKLSSLPLTYLNILRSVFTNLEKLTGRLLGTHPIWEQEFTQMDVECVIGSSYASNRMAPILQTAANMGIDTLILTNSWKDIYVNPHLPVSPTVIGVWTQQMAVDLFEGEPRLQLDKVKVVGSLHLEKFLKPSDVMRRDAFCQNMGLDPDRSYICYTAASPKAVLNEVLVVKFLLDSIEQQKLIGNPQVLLRLNPMEDGTRFEVLRSQYPDLVIQEPVWEWDAERDWCCALSADSELWLATVYYAALNVSIPSTVTLEFAALEKPVVNVCFDLPQALLPDRSNRRFWDGEFYKVIRKAELAKPAFSAEQLLDGINAHLNGSTPSLHLPLGLETQPVDAVTQAVSEILNG